MVASRVLSISIPVGLVVEGEAEIGAIPELLGNCGVRNCKPIRFGGQPTECDEETFKEFVRLRIVPHVRAVSLKGVSRIVIVIDRENRSDCPGAFAQLINQVVTETMGNKYSYAGSPPISVVCVDRKLENWLIADPEGIYTHNYIVKDLSRSVGSMADGKDAEGMLKAAYKPGRYYHRRMDAPRLACKVRTVNRDVRMRSPSLDKMLRVCGIPPI